MRRAASRVNGNTAQLGEQADAEEDVIELDGTRVKTRQEPQPVYLMLCKPRGFVTTMHDERAGVPSRSSSRTYRSACIRSGGWIITPRAFCS